MGVLALSSKPLLDTTSRSRLKPKRRLGIGALFTFCQSGLQQQGKHFYSTGGGKFVSNLTPHRISVNDHRHGIPFSTSPVPNPPKRQPSRYTLIHATSHTHQPTNPPPSPTAPHAPRPSSGPNPPPHHSAARSPHPRPRPPTGPPRPRRHPPPKPSRCPSRPLSDSKMPPPPPRRPPPPAAGRLAGRLRPSLRASRRSRRPAVPALLLLLP